MPVVATTRSFVSFGSRTMDAENHHKEPPDDVIEVGIARSKRLLKPLSANEEFPHPNSRAIRPMAVMIRKR
jgi:hypothetical protein